MPVITGVQGYTNLTQQTRLCIETGTSPGESLLMPLTTGAATMSLTTQPNTISATTGMHLHFLIIGNSTAGTIGIVGTNVAGGGLTSITYHVPIAPQNPQGYSEFTTTEVFATVTAASITLTSLTPCQVMVFGSFAGKFLIPATSDSEEKFLKHSPTDRRGILFKNIRVVQLIKEVMLAKFDAAAYPDSLWAPYMLIGNTPTITTQPAVATTKLASTARAATMTLTTGPAAPGEFLIFAITGNTASGTIVLNGTDNFGNAVSETITASSAATQTLYSTKRYASLVTPGSNQFTTTGLTSSSITVTGVFAWTYAWTYDGLTNLTPYSAALEIYDGVMGTVLPGTILTDGTWDWQKEKEIAFTSKGECQDFLIVGDNSPTSTANYLSGTNPFATIAQPTTLPMVSWPASFYLDTLPGTPLTSQDGTLLTFKFGIVTGRKWKYAGDGQQRPSFVTWNAEHDFTLDATMVFQNYKYYEIYFKPNQKFALSTTFQGNLLGKDASNTYYEQIQIIAPVKLDTWHVDYSKNAVEANFKAMSEYDFGLGYAYKFAITAQVPPTYTS